MPPAPVYSPPPLQPTVVKGGLHLRAAKSVEVSASQAWGKRLGSCSAYVYRAQCPRRSVGSLQHHAEQRRVRTRTFVFMHKHAPPFVCDTLT